MKVRGGQWKRQLLLTVAVFTLGVAIGMVHIFKGKSVNAPASNLLMKTVCVGRFLIDVPQDAIVTFSGTTLGGWRISARYDETDEEFDVRLASKEAEVRAAKNGRGWDSLESITRVNAENLRGEVIVFNRQWTHIFENQKRVDLDFAAVDGHARIAGASIDFNGEYLNTSYVEKLIQLIKKLRTQGLGDIPESPGFCFEQSMIADPLSVSQHESTVMFIGLEDHPDLSIVLRTAAGLDPAPRLLERDSRNEIKQEFRSHFHTFRQGERIVNGMRGEELLERVHEMNGTRGHDFEWEAFSTPDDVLRPDLALEMSTGHGRPGKPVQASLSDAEAIALWDKMLSSLRLRPVKIREEKKAALPLSVTRTIAGEICPESGWWICGDADTPLAVRGGEKQYFRQGVRMPQAEIVAPQTFLQKIRGKEQSFSRAAATIWTFSPPDIGVQVSAQCAPVGNGASSPSTDKS
jgi:hypothetical protein